MADAAGNAFANYSSGYLRANWNNRGAAGSRAAGVKAISKGACGQLAGMFVTVAGTWAAEAGCDEICTQGGT